MSIKPWDITINDWASLDNPTRTGIVISVTAKYAEMTNVSGDTWRATKANLRVIGSIAQDVKAAFRRVSEATA